MNVLRKTLSFCKSFQCTEQCPKSIQPTIRTVSEESKDKLKPHLTSLQITFRMPSTNYRRAFVICHYKFDAFALLILAFHLVSDNWCDDIEENRFGKRFPFRKLIDHALDPIEIIRNCFHYWIHSSSCVNTSTNESNDEKLSYLIWSSAASDSHWLTPAVLASASPLYKSAIAFSWAIVSINGCNEFIPLHISFDLVAESSELIENIFSHRIFWSLVSARARRYLLFISNIFKYGFDDMTNIHRNILLPFFQAFVRYVYAVNIQFLIFL